MEVPNRVLKTAPVRWRELSWLQGGLKRIGPKAMEKLKKSILSNGFVMPFHVWDTGKELFILDGHHRQRAMQELEKDAHAIPEELPAIFISCKDKQEAAKLVLIYSSIYANVTESGLDEFSSSFELDLEMLKFEVDLPDVDIARFGYGEVSEDEVAPVPLEGKSKPGDIWELGRHRIICGDALDTDALDKLMQGKRSAMIFTDPPYNVDYGASKNPRHKIRSIENDKQTTDEWETFCKSLYANFRIYNEGDIYMWGASGPEGMRMRLWLVEAGAHWSATIVWKKQQLVLSPAMYQRMYEPCFYGWFGKSSFVGDRRQTEVWQFDRPTSSKEHPTMKPVALCANGIQNSSKPDDIVLDFFLGSGSTLIAAEQTGRICYGIELEPKYVDVAVDRWVNLTGGNPILNGSEVKWTKIPKNV